MPEDFKKNSLYTICDTLIEHRRYQTGLNNIIDIPLKILIHEIREYGLDKIKNDLRVLAESLTDSGHALLDIDVNLLKDLTESNYTGITVKAQYSKNDIKTFVKRMKESDKEMSQNNNKILITINHNYSSLTINYNEKRHKIRTGQKSIYLDICLLLLGKPLSYICGSNPIYGAPDERPMIFIEEPDYVVGKTKLDHAIIYDYAVSKNQESPVNPTQKEKNKQIYDGVRYINQKLLNKFSFSLFDYTNSEYWINSDIAKKLLVKDLNSE